MAFAVFVFDSDIFLWVCVGDSNKHRKDLIVRYSTCHCVFVRYKKTSETLSTAGQKTSAAFSNFGSAITRKFGDMR